ncbi:hypothetical protein NLG97_g4266 [Lecanicillium saksenae]|uniref:Uncharacterized protein n=1 Tax=Lecanicillium saksenae TaxID=468837 RepID=A0ACC1QWZ4_9HYPO|nr:hypothetical protein NLG97_g4266 [Lecanicillium saksenae]
MLSASVLIVGAGPVGLWLAIQLRTAGIDVLVIDSMPSSDSRSPHSKALAMSAGTLATFGSRGLDAAFLEHGIPLPTGHFGGLPTRLNFDYETLGQKHSFGLAIPQTKTESILQSECESLRTRFEWGLELTTLKQNEDSVVVTAIRHTAGGADGLQDVRITASWVVGCDGTHSATRSAVGIAFNGEPSTIKGVMADFQMDRPYGPVPILDPQPGQENRVRPLLTPIGDGLHYRIVDVREDKNPSQLSLDGIQNLLQAHYGTDFGAHSVVWSSTFGSAFRLAGTFRRGRVLLAGDAAHQFLPAGGQGMNLGIQDATNLAWKLALAANGTSDPATADRLLDTYSSERLPAAQETVQNTMAQMALFTANSFQDFALRNVLSEALKSTELNQLWAKRVSGFGEPRSPYRSATNQHHWMVGTRLSHIPQIDRFSGLFAKLASFSQFALITFSERASPASQDALQSVCSQWHGHVQMLNFTAPEESRWSNIYAVIIRPDERVAWVAETNSSSLSVAKSLEQFLQVWL